MRFFVTRTTSEQIVIEAKTLDAAQAAIASMDEDNYEWTDTTVSYEKMEDDE